MAKGNQGGSQESQTDQERQHEEARARAAAAAEAQQNQQDQDRQPGDNDQATAQTANPSVEQVTQVGETQPAEGQRIREDAQDESDSGVVTLASVVTTGDKEALKYDDSGRLVNKDGKPIALAADATDPDVGWTVQQAGAHLDEGDRVAYPGGPQGVPDQTVHPSELPDPLAALQAGLLPQNAGVLNIDPDKFDSKKPIEA